MRREKRKRPKMIDYLDMDNISELGGWKRVWWYNACFRTVALPSWLITSDHRLIFTMGFYLEPVTWQDWSWSMIYSFININLLIQSGELINLLLQSNACWRNVVDASIISYEAVWLLSFCLFVFLSFYLSVFLSFCLSDFWSVPSLCHIAGTWRSNGDDTWMPIDAMW